MAYSDADNLAQIVIMPSLGWFCKCLDVFMEEYDIQDITYLLR